jgi:hypothetical protein
MSIIGSNILAGASGQAGGGGAYEIERSVRFNSADSAYLSRTPGTAGNRRTYTISFWLKTSVTNTSNRLFGARNDTNNYMEAYIRDTNKINWYFWGGGIQYELVTTQVFRDPSAWYHLMFVLDTTQATANNRIRIYANGSEITAFDTRANPSLNFECSWNNTVANRIGVSVDTSSAFLNGSLADIHFIDSQALTPSAFGEFDTNGVWQPKAFSGGSYGTNGFRLPFSDNSTAAALGTDSSGSGNTWTVNNISVTAGSGNDSLVDSPTNYGTDTGAGGEVRGNYCTWNPLYVDTSNNLPPTFANANLDVSWRTGDWNVAMGTIKQSSGKWYWEMTLSVGNRCMLGITKYNTFNSANAFYYSPDVYVYFSSNGNKWNNNTQTAYGASFVQGDVIGVALDLDAGTLVFYKNGVSQGTAFSSLSGNFAPVWGTDTTGNTHVANFGQRPFAYTAPSGFKALCTTNLPEPTIADGSTAMDVALYTGNGSTQTISGLNFSPDFGWFKRRGPSAASHFLFDQVRGAGKFLVSNTTAAEGNDSVNTLQSFDSTGYTMGSTGAMNESGSTYVVWSWDAGSSTVTNTAGSITSQVRANASAGFSVVTFTSSSSVSTVGHGLGVAPYLIITKNRSVSNTWWTYHNAIGNTKAMRLDTTAAETTISSTWNNTSPTSTVFTVGGEWGNGNNIVAYCFAPVAGYSAFGSYTGNGSATDGPFVYTGFRPAFVLIKCSSSDQSGNAWWLMYDNKRLGYNPDNAHFGAQSSNAEFLSASPNGIDLTSNGFKLRDTNTSRNASGATYIYYAVAENPFQYARAR